MGLTIGIIVGGAIGGGVTIIIIFMLAFGYREYQMSKSKRLQINPNDMADVPKFFDKQYLARMDTPDPTLPRETSFKEEHKNIKVEDIDNN